MSLEMRTVAYGPAADQVGDLYLSGTSLQPVICLLHGGFWRLPYGRDHIAPIAHDLALRGYAVWNLEYRRVGTAGGGWPGTLQDVAAGVDYLAELEAQGAHLDLSRITLIGHSAGGHLALWCAAAAARPGELALGPRRVSCAAAIGLAPVADLVEAYRLDCGRGATANFLGGTPEAEPARYQEASPALRLPLGLTQRVLHGTLDEDVPVEMSRSYASAAAAAGDDIQYEELTAVGHMEFVDPTSVAHAALCAFL